jgi:hypothetical protein
MKARGRFCLKGLVEKRRVRASRAHHVNSHGRRRGGAADGAGAPDPRSAPRPPRSRRRAPTCGAARRFEQGPASFRLAISCRHRGAVARDARSAPCPAPPPPGSLALAGTLALAVVPPPRGPPLACRVRSPGEHKGPPPPHLRPRIAAAAPLLALAVVPLVQRLDGDAAQQLAREDAQQRPREVERVEDGAVVVRALAVAVGFFWGGSGVWSRLGERIG